MFVSALNGYALARPMTNTRFASRRTKTQSAAFWGKSAAALGGAVFGVGYFEDHLGASLLGTTLVAGGVTSWGIAKLIEKAQEAMGAFRRYSRGHFSRKSRA